MKVSEDDLRFCPEPTIFYNIGDRVRIGNLVDAKITDVLYDGKAYEVTYSTINKKYGQEIRTDGFVGTWMWYEIQPYVKNESHNIICNSEYRLYYSQKELCGLLTICYHFGCDRNPEYQRDYVWGVEDEEALIDSIFHNIDIGKFVFVRLPYSSTGYGYEILDGKQRLKAITDFYENRLAYKGLYYKDLNPAEKNHFRDYNVSYGELAEPTDEQKLKTFILLNTRGKAMTKEEMDHAKFLYEKEKSGVQED